MRCVPAFLASAALAALAIAPITARAQARLQHACCDAARAMAPDSGRVRSILVTADEFAANGRVRQALSLLASTAADQRAAGDYPLVVLRRLAQIQYGAGQDFDAARTLDDLADAAQHFGDPATELRARLDAALLYQDLRMTDRVPELAVRINDLLKSPVIDEKLRLYVTSRMAQR